MKRTLTTLLVTVLGLPLLTACQDSPEPTDAETPEPGDPAHYAPPGWPYEIGDKIFNEDKEALATDFVSVQSQRHSVTPALALHLVDDVVYTARFEYSGGPDGVYMGHFPLNELPWSDEIEEYRRGLPMGLREYEHTLPPEFHGKIKYGLPPRIPPNAKSPSDIGSPGYPPYFDLYQ